MFSCEFCEMSKNTFFTETSGQLLLEISKNTFSYRIPPVAASVYDGTSDFIANIKNVFICWDKFLEDTIENNF